MKKETINLDGFGVTTGDQPDHYAAIGRVIVAFSSIEIAVHDCVYQLLGISMRAGRLISGAQRYGDNVKLVRDLAKLRNIEGREVLERGLDQAGNLKRIRDAVAHKTWMFKGEVMAFSSIWTSRTFSNEDTELFSIEYLNKVSKHANEIGAMIRHPFTGEFYVSAASESWEGFRELYEARLTEPFPKA